MYNAFRLNLGCGSDLQRGYVNVDAEGELPLTPLCHMLHEFDKRVFKGHICNLHLPDNHVDYIWSAHALQCLNDRAFVPMALAEWLRVLKPGAVCNIEVPNPIPLMRMYLNGDCSMELLNQGMYGHNRPDLRQTISFDGPYLTKLMEEAGFIKVYSGNTRSTHNSKTNLSLYGSKPE